MTNQEAIKIIEDECEHIKSHLKCKGQAEDFYKELGDMCIAFYMGINALSAIEDIKQEIKEEKEFAYADFERYKVECLGIDWEDAYDSLPDDDFRYGMERCLDIIDKHIGEEKE